jgi:CrcB protein
MTLTGVLCVALGGALGSVARYLLTLGAIAQFGLGFPWGTLAINVAGSALIGVVAGLGVGGDLRLFLVTGVLGGFTTFSAFSLETGLLWERSPMLSAAYVAASLILALAAFAVCFGLARR